MELFGKTWTKKYVELINTDSRYKENGKGWKNPIRFVSISGDSQKAVWLELSNGTCLKSLSENDALQAYTEYEIRAEESAWKNLLENNGDPLVALMTGKLKLTKGSLFTLSRYTSSAKDLVRLAVLVDEQKLEESFSEPELNVMNESNVNHQNRNEIITMKRRLQTELFPYRLYEKAKLLGIWNPSDIDFEQDKRDWQTCSPQERELILHLTSLFQSGEESVTNEIVPLLLAVSGEKRIEEELYLTTFLFEEAKHTDFFNRFISLVIQTDEPDLDRFKGPSYQKLFDIELNTVMRNLLTEPSFKNQLLASVTYNMIVEGSLAETGYQAYYKMLDENNLMPGLKKGIGLLKQDESRHIAYGIYLLSRILIENPDLKPIFDQRMSYCLELVIGVIHEIFDSYDVMPFGLKAEDFIDYATEQFQRRYERIEKSLLKQEPFTES